MHVPDLGVPQPQLTHGDLHLSGCTLHHQNLAALLPMIKQSIKDSCCCFITAHVMLVKTHIAQGSWGKGLSFYFETFCYNSLVHVQTFENLSAIHRFR